MEHDPATRVLLSSGYSLDSTIQELISKGALGFLQKPYSAEELGTKAKELLEL